VKAAVNRPFAEVNKDNAVLTKMQIKDALYSCSAAKPAAIYACKQQT
jgi:hypothetical protein